MYEIIPADISLQYIIDTYNIDTKSHQAGASV